MPLQTVCLRPVKPGPDEAALAAPHLEITRWTRQGGNAHLTPSALKGRQMLRVSLGAGGIERRHVEAP